MGEAAVNEPSMDDILSSIRMIIAEEGASEPTSTAAIEVAEEQSIPVENTEYQANNGVVNSGHQPLEIDAVDVNKVEQEDTGGSVSLANIAENLRSSADSKLPSDILQEPNMVENGYSHLNND